MNSNSRKDIFYQVLYFLCIAVSFINNYELAFSVWIITVLLTLQRSYSVTFFKYIACFTAIVLIAFISGLFRDPNIYNAIRDLTYLLKPIVGIFAGYQLCKINSQKALKTLIYTGAIISLIHLIIIIKTIVQFGTFDVNQIRMFSGYFSDYEVYILVILIYSKKFQLQIERKRIIVLLVLVGLSSFLYLARTNFIQFFILIMGMEGYYAITKKSIVALSTIVISVLLTYSAILYINPKRNGKGLETLLYKIKIAPIEPFKTRINKDDWKDFNDNYRSYENIIAVKQVSNKGLGAVLFGEGLGATLDLGREVWSNDGEFVRYIPIVHNGYMTVFLKSGIFGVFFLLLFIVILYRQQKSNDPLIKQINYLLIGTSIFLVLSNWVFLGLYLKLDNKSIIIGYLLALKHIIHKENLRRNNEQKIA